MFIEMVSDDNSPKKLKNKGEKNELSNVILPIKKP